MYQGICNPVWFTVAKIQHPWTENNSVERHWKTLNIYWKRLGKSRTNHRKQVIFYFFTLLLFYLYTMSDVTFNIYGGNNQILPNATKAEQNFYGDQFAEKTLAKDGEAPQPLTEEEQALSIYIYKVESLRGYITLLRSCKTARDLGNHATARAIPHRWADSEAEFHFPSPSLRSEMGERAERRQHPGGNQYCLDDPQKDDPSSRSLKHPQKSILRYMGKYPKILRQVS